MQLVTIAPGHQLEASAGASFNRCATIRPGLRSRINSAYRTPTEQAVLRARYLSNPSKYAFALPPSQSMHCKGLALDIDSSPANADHAWLVGNGAAYGWFRTNPKEPWHFEYDASKDTQGDDDMSAEDVWAYTNPDVASGSEDTYLHLRAARWAAEEAKTVAKRTEAKVDALIASLAKGTPIKLDPAAIAAIADAVGPEIAEATVDEIDARELKRLNQVKDA